MSVLFISGIDTDIGKTYATGMMAKALMQQGISVITQKLVQTGVSIDTASGKINGDIEVANGGKMNIADDIVTHRQLMGIPLQPCDLDFTTCLYRYEKPASPHLSVKLANAVLDFKIITKSTQQLQQSYDAVLLEGAGGLLVPITEQLLTLDYIAEQGYPVVLVTSGRLGSINHTLTLHSVIYNHIHDNAAQTDDEIANSTIDYLKNYLARHYPNSYWLQMAQQTNSTIGNDSLALPPDFI